MLHDKRRKWSTGVKFKREMYMGPGIKKNSHAIPQCLKELNLGIKSCRFGGEALRGYSQILPAGLIGQAQEWWVKRQDFYKQK